jgi:hypothetical protein
MTEQQRLVRGLASSISVDPKEIELAADLITAVAAGRIDIHGALKAARSSNLSPRSPSRAR